MSLAGGARGEPYKVQFERDASDGRQFKHAEQAGRGRVAEARAGVPAGAMGHASPLGQRQARLRSRPDGRSKKGKCSPAESGGWLGIETERLEDGAKVCFGESRYDLVCDRRVAFFGRKGPPGFANFKSKPADFHAMLAALLDSATHETQENHSSGSENTASNPFSRSAILAAFSSPVALKVAMYPRRAQAGQRLADRCITLTLVGG